MNSIKNPNKTAKKLANSPLDDVLHGPLARAAAEDVARTKSGSPEASGDGGDDKPPSSPRMPIPLGPQFAIRIGDGAVMMAVEGHAEDRDLAGREVWTCFALSPEETAFARKTMNHAEHDAAARIGAKLPKKP